MDIFSGLVDEKTLRVLTVFLENPKELYHINKVSEASGVALATTFRIINKLSKNNFLRVRKISKFKVYQLEKNSKTKKLRRLL